MIEKIFDDCFGGCPECGSTHGWLSVGRDHWYSDDHATSGPSAQTCSAHGASKPKRTGFIMPELHRDIGRSNQ
jgi:hypothetical protein